MAERWIEASDKDVAAARRKVDKLIRSGRFKRMTLQRGPWKAYCAVPKEPSKRERALCVWSE